MLTRFLALLVAVAAFGALLPAPVSAQSLDIRNPAPLVAGENHGTVDSMVGPQYWLIRCHKGAVHISLRFNSMGLFGNPTTATIQEVLHEANGKVLGSRVVTSPGQMVQNDWPGTCSSKSTMIVELRPPGNSLVRTGGDYSLTVDGDGVDYAGGAAAAGPDRIVGTYSVMVCAPDFDCQSSLAAHFAADGSVRLTDGHAGTWSAFDPDSQIYTVVIGRDRYSLKLIPGRGLFGTNDLSVPIFQAVRPN
jgi:hypothetical protein